MAIDENYLLVFLISNAVILGIACLSVARFERRYRHLEEFWASPTGAALGDSKTDTGGESLRITQELEKRVGELQRTVKVMEIKSPPIRHVEERALPIENALRMAKNGASVNDLTRNCGLSYGEASLMYKLHGQARPSVAKR
jgi:hypothetical protein